MPRACFCVCVREAGICGLTQVAVLCCSCRITCIRLLLAKLPPVALAKGMRTRHKKRQNKRPMKAEQNRMEGPTPKSFSYKLFLAGGKDATDLSTLSLVIATRRACPPTSKVASRPNVGMGHIQGRQRNSGPRCLSGNDMLMMARSWDAARACHACPVATLVQTHQDTLSSRGF